MEYDLLYPESEREMLDAPCIIAAVFFSKEELLDIGVEPGSIEINDTFVEENEFIKAFKLWRSPLFLSDFMINIVLSSELIIGTALLRRIF